MNKHIFKGEWASLKGKVKSKWGELTDDDVAKAEGDVEALIGSVQAKYGYDRAKAESEVNDWLSSLDK